MRQLCKKATSSARASRLLERAVESFAAPALKEGDTSGRGLCNSAASALAEASAEPLFPAEPQDSHVCQRAPSAEPSARRRAPVGSSLLLLLLG